MDLSTYESTARETVDRAADLVELGQAYARYVGRHSELNRELRLIRHRDRGIALNALRHRLDQAFARRQAELESADISRAAAIDVGAPGRPPVLGRLHPITVARREVEDVLLVLGYELRDDCEAETVEANFDALRYPKTHPVRSPRSSYYLESGAVLRSGTGASVVHALRSAPSPIYAASIGRCFHNVGRDAAHADVFLQVTAVALDEGLTLADLKGTLGALSAELYGGVPEVRLTHTYNPFTAPSVDVTVPCPVCDGGCLGCRGTGVLDFAGGMVHPGILRGAGHDPETVTAFAFALGIEHNVAQVRHGVADPRLLWRNDLQVLRSL